MREHGDDIDSYLAPRAAELNADDPQLRGHGLLGPIIPGHNRDHHGYAYTVAWAATRLVVGAGRSVWGEFGDHRPEMPATITAGLLDATDVEAFTDKLFTPPISLRRTSAWVGPLYRVGSNGNHRLHTARMLNLPWLAAAVHFQATAPAWNMSGLVLADSDAEERERGGSFDKCLAERLAVVEGLLRRGVVDGILTGKGRALPVLHCSRLPATWLLRAPAHAARVNAVYESRYPGALQ
ncbi:hypothetical protein AB0F91_33180 [Amycolatopsis sp. NPDC023774]|uniref:hypothetical protein n=1 Tax=Amycolatopsis sp. NPDC023774 TaxID=3155015 RepID=UPI0033CF3A7F